MKITNLIKTFTLSSIVYAAPLVAQNYSTTPLSQQDTFEKKITPQGTNNDTILFLAPKPSVEIANKLKNAKIVVDTKTNTLFEYDKDGNAIQAYLVASGKKTSPSKTGSFIVTHIETYPYRTAPIKTKRRKNPKAYGPKIICLNKIDKKTGTQSPTGQFIHGNNNPNSIGKYASLGCIRMDNTVIKELSKKVRRGDIVLIK